VIDVVVLSLRARKALRKCPPHIRHNFMAWVGSVQRVGLERTRLVHGYHDEPLKGEWVGFRSIRLSRTYRAIYSIQDDSSVEFALVETVNKHEY
jgi:proteic killer suppression protein